jgi:hypothetical protein
MEDTMDKTQALAEITGIQTGLAMIKAAVEAGQPAPALAGGVLDAAQRLLDTQRLSGANRPEGEFPGVSMGLLAYDISDLIGRAEYPIEISQDDIEPNLPAFLRACVAHYNAHPDGE